jgi:hypothetical protein
LQIGEVTNSINVIDAAPLMQAGTSDIGQVIDRQKLEALPSAEPRGFLPCGSHTGRRHD